MTVKLNSYWLILCQALNFHSNVISYYSKSVKDYNNYINNNFKNIFKKKVFASVY